MSRGGARNRSGPAASESSGRSDRRGFKLTALPAEGYSGPVPDFPLRKRVIWNIWFEGSGRNREEHRDVDEGATESVWDRELELWEWLWRTPQACAWSLPSERWRLHTIGMYVRTFVLCESSEATAADKNSLHRFADQIGMTTAGLAEMGWKVAVDEVAAKAADAPAPAVPAASSSRSRMRVVRDSAGA